MTNPRLKYKASCVCKKPHPQSPLPISLMNGDNRTILIDAWRRNVVRLGTDGMHFPRIQAPGDFSIYFIPWSTPRSYNGLSQGCHSITLYWVNELNHRTLQTWSWKLYFSKESIILCLCQCPLAPLSSLILAAVWTGLTRMGFCSHGDEGRWCNTQQCLSNESWTTESLVFFASLGTVYRSFPRSVYNLLYLPGDPLESALGP